MASVDFYFDFISPYAYLASRELPTLCARVGVELNLRPVLFAGLLNHWGQRGPAEIPPKAAHTIRDCMRYALARGIPCRPPLHHPFNPLTALRASLSSVAGAEQPEVVRAIFDLGWAEGGDLGSPEAIQEALKRAGVASDDILERVASQSAKAGLRQQTEEAIARGVFGVPTMIAGNELFWGLDQIGHLELHLKGEDPLAGVDFNEIDFRGPSAWRTGISRHGTD